MQIFLGDLVTIMKNDTWVTGTVSGIVLDSRRELERVYIESIDMAFWMADNWKFVEDEEWKEGDDDGEI